ncbi:hypothetical protein EVAR_43304_1 [Eumeta japonica]|uniref:Uncharacterized protein n=1 Tax=Eumeta variegata TaxID=151549 RepID=A0A4C1X231_EUMVA|nr:hypothetical protein EVAR_43304_1 [Eumeta japonica]
MQTARLELRPGTKLRMKPVSKSSVGSGLESKSRRPPRPELKATVRAPERTGCVRLSRTKNPSEALKHSPLAHGLYRLHLSSQKAQGVSTARRSGNPSGLLQRNNVIVIGIWSVKTTGALPGHRNRVRARRADGRVTGVYHRDGRTNLTAAARCTLRGTPHTHARAEPDTTERGSKEH